MQSETGELKMCRAKPNHVWKGQVEQSVTCIAAETSDSVQGRNKQLKEWTDRNAELGCFFIPVLKEALAVGRYKAEAHSTPTLLPALVTFRRSQSPDVDKRKIPRYR